MRTVRTSVLLASLTAFSLLALAPISAQADPEEGCTGEDGTFSVCTPCDWSEWHVHVLGHRVGTGIHCIP